MSLFEKLFRRNNQTQGVVPMPEQFMEGMQPGLAGAGGFDAPMPDTTMMANQPIFQNFREQEEMVGLANVTLDNDPVIEEFANKLRGYKIRYDIDPYNAMPVKKIERFGRPFCNNDGINELVGDLRMHMNKAVMLSNVPKADKKMIEYWCLIIAIDTLEKIAMNSERWCVDRTKRSTILDLFMSAVWFNMMRSFEDGERTKLYPTQKNISMNSTLPHMMPQKKSVLEM